MTLTLPDSLRDWLEEQARSRGHSVERFVSEVLLREQASLNWEAVESKLGEALDSGPATPMTPYDWDRLRNRIHQRSSQPAGDA